jgi:hypothetical protein
VAPGALCSVKARFQPTGSTLGPRTGTLVVDSNAAGAPDSVALTGTAAGSATLKVTPATFDFGDVSVGAVSPLQKVVVQNISASPVSITSVQLGGADPGQFQTTSDTCTGAGLAPGATCFVRARFAPTTAGGKSAQLQLRNGSTTLAAATLNGTGIAVPEVRIAPATYSFGAVVIGQQSPNQKWTVKNTGGTVIHVDAVDLQGGDAAQFQRNASTCVDVDLAPGESCTVKVRFRPAGAPGPRATQLVVVSDAPGTPAADLSGTAAEV